MLGVIVNTVAVLVGSLIGLLCKKGIPQRISSAVMVAIGLCTIAIGIDGVLTGENALVMIVSIVLGIIVGELLDLDTKLNNVVERVAVKSQGKEEGSRFAQAFITACLLFCVGAMTIVGSLNAGLDGNNEMLFTKSLLDFISSIMLSASLGIGVLFAAVFVLVFQGAIVLFAQYLAPVLTEFMIAEMVSVGSLIILALGFNLTGITKIKVVNYLPAIVFAPFVCVALSLIGVA